MKYALLGWNDKQAKRGAYTEAKQLEQRYPSNVTAFNANSTIDIGRIKDEFDKIVYTYQQPNQYLTNTLFDIKRYNLDIQYIRKEYFQIQWTSDFVIRYQDGSFGVREIIRKAALANRATCERLELSRRYWTFRGCENWKVVIVEGGEPFAT